MKVRVACKVDGKFVGFSESTLALHPQLKEQVSFARYKKADTGDRMTWVYDEFLGFSLSWVEPFGKFSYFYYTKY